MKLTLTTISLKEANAFVAARHRHHGPTRGHRFAMAARLGDKIVGVVIVGRPASRCIDRRIYCEVNRLCTDGTANACSFLYGAARRATRALGYERLLTYTLPDEGGASLRAAGFAHAGRTKGGEWDTPARRRDPAAQPVPKDRWEMTL